MKANCPHCGKNIDLLTAYPAASNKIELFLRNLEEVNGNRTRCAEAMGVSLRTIRNWIHICRNLNLNVPEPDRNFFRHRGPVSKYWDSEQRRIIYLHFGKKSIRWLEAATGREEKDIIALARAMGLMHRLKKKSEQ